jgi:hypothetical protein
MQFASFTYPRHVFHLYWPLPRRLAAFKAKSGWRGNSTKYQPEPRPAQPGDRAFGFYLEEFPGLRWKYADDVIRLNHRGWFADDCQDTTIRGIVGFLPHGRGFLAGWTMGRQMASQWELCPYETAEEAARIADGIAERTAENERDYQAREEEKRREEEEREAVLMDQSGEH